MGDYTSFEDMTVWQRAMDLAVGVHGLTATLPRVEDYGLTSQMRRSALSVPANVAEGYGRWHTKDKVNFYYNARGSLCETRNHLIYGNRVGYFSEEQRTEFVEQIELVARELNSLIKSLRA